LLYNQSRPPTGFGFYTCCADIDSFIFLIFPPLVLNQVVIWRK